METTTACMGPGGSPGAGENHARDEAEGIEEERHIEQEDLDANARPPARDDAILHCCSLTA